MFTQPCFIRKNTPELIKKLEELGYFYTYYHNGNGIYCYNNIAQTFTYNNEIPKECIGIPKDNEELFLALAALRDDTDKNQWFIMDVGAYTNINVGDWFIATDMNGGKHIGAQIEPTYCYKATVEELIEHFK